MKTYMRIRIEQQESLYMHREDPEDPFSAYQVCGRDYDTYLASVRDITL